MKLIILYLLTIILAAVSLKDYCIAGTDSIQTQNAIFLRLMKYARPDMDENIQRNITESGKNVMVPLAVETPYSLFLNVNTITTETGEPLPVQNESSISVNPTNPKNLLCSAVDDRDSNSAWVYVSSDGGYSWKNINLGKAVQGWLSSNDPSVAFDVDGTGYLVYGGFPRMADSSDPRLGQNGVFLAKTTDEGRTWKSHIPVILHNTPQTIDSTFEDKYYITVDNSPQSSYFKHLYIPWKRVSPRDSATQIVLAKSTDKGESWLAPVNVSYRVSGSSEDTTYGQSFPLTATGPNGEVYVVWNHGIEHGVGFASSDDGGATFGQPRIIQRYNIFGETKYLDGQGYRHCVKGKVRAETYPSIVCDIYGGARSGWLYLTWAGDNPPNMYFSRSTDKGDTWSKPKYVSSDTAGDQFWQWLCIDPENGDIAVMYLDSRDDPANINVQTYVSLSRDGGDTWFDRRVSDINSDLRLNPFKGNAFAGDYSGCAFLNGIIYPSWVDMRNAVVNILDDDVFTAVVNTRSPAYPGNFKAAALPDQPKKIKLTWIPPTEKAFGQPLDKSEFHYSLSMNKNYFGTIASSETELIIDNLTPFVKYDFAIKTVTAADSSIDTRSSAFPGGSMQPLPPIILSAAGNESRESILNIRMPGLRSDSITPLANLSRIVIYSGIDSVAGMKVNPSDTGRILQVVIQENERGYYKYQAAAIDDFQSQGISTKPSELSNEVRIYTGKIENDYSENFDGMQERYYLAGHWGIYDKFSHSKPNSFTESPGGNYKDNARDTFLIFPVISSGNKTSLDFWHAAIVEKNDTAFIEYSIGKAGNWFKLDNYDKDHYPAWSDGVLNDEDWVMEHLLVPAIAGDTVTFRFRFYSSIFKNSDGWYIDDIDIKTFTLVEDENDNIPDLIIYPNPAGTYLYIKSKGYQELNCSEIKIFNMFGERINCCEILRSRGHDYLTLDISGLSPGIYMISEGKSLWDKFVIYR
ncbi:MAG: Por Secre tail protein [Bacteroidota bacterium]|nr:Por Secre tail protein [Bacteroidota bacterium]